MKQPIALPALLALVTTSCVPIYVDRERYQPTQVVQGYTPKTVDRLAEDNEKLLREEVPDARGGRLYDHDIEPTRLLAPGHRIVEGPGADRDKATKDQAALSFAEERRFFRRREGLPAYCVALSGGGLRSAAFSMGVLSALYAHGDLDKTDILSAVSGGAYTLSWYYAQHMHRQAEDSRKVDAELFDPDGRYQKFLAENAGIFNTAGYAAVTAANLAASPLNFLANGVFGWHLNTTPARSIYEYRLRSIFHRSPDGALDTFGFHNLGRMLGYETGLRPEPDPAAAIAWAKTQPKQLPYFIINTTAFIESTSDYHGASLRNSVYEFTPLMFGSDGYGRFRYDPATPTWPMAFGRAVSVSGAALDGTALIAGNSQRTLWSLLNLDLGFYMNNPALHPSVIPQHRVLPFPLYYLHHYPRDVKGTDIYLSDGGHSENLGAYALVRRLCERITIVDGESDPTYEFDAYFNLKAALKRDMGVILNVPAIEGLKDTELRDLRRDKAARADPDVRKDLARKLSPKEVSLGRPLIDPLESLRWNSVAANPVMEGSVACIPHPERKTAALSVQYVKLAYRPDDALCRDHDEIVKQCAKDFLNRDLCWRDRIIGKKTDHEAKVALHYFCERKGTREERMDPSIAGISSVFPQQPTTDQNFSEWQFRAYRDLGRMLMENTQRNPGEQQTPDCAMK